MKQKYYVVFVGRNPGMYATWDDCNAHVHGFSGCKHKSFPTFEDATNACNQYQAFFPDRTTRRATGSVVVRASHRPSTMDSGNCVAALTDRTQIATRNAREAANAERVTV